MERLSSIPIIFLVCLSLPFEVVAQKEPNEKASKINKIESSKLNYEFSESSPERTEKRRNAIELRLLYKQIVHGTGYTKYGEFNFFFPGGSSSEESEISELLGDPDKKYVFSSSGEVSASNGQGLKFAFFGDARADRIINIITPITRGFVNREYILYTTTDKRNLEYLYKLWTYSAEYEDGRKLRIGIFFNDKGGISSAYAFEDVSLRITVD